MRSLLVFAALLGLSIFRISSVSAQDAVWSAQFYSNPYLTGNPVTTQQVSSIAYNWSYASPVAGINADNFTVRFSTDVVLPAATYRFYALADDNVRVTVDFTNTIIDTFTTPTIGQVIIADVTLAAGAHHIQVDYREVTGDAYVYVEWGDANSNAAPMFVQRSQTSVNLGPWIGEYYNNPNLVGSPAAILSEASPVHNWGYGAPAANVGADNFSVRWTSSVNLTGGTYEISTLADDGVRIYVNGVLVINEWHLASGQRYTQTINLPAGVTGIQIDFFENTGIAFLDFRLRQLDTNIVQTSTPLATITAQRLNVRDFPSPSLGNILFRVNRGSTYPIVGRNADGSWWLIDVNGTTGWVSSPFVTELNTETVPIVETTVTTVPVNNTPVDAGTNYTVTATPYTVNMRSGPGLGYDRIEQFRAGTTAEVIGRNPSSTWWQINYNGVIGWVSATYARIEPGAVVDTIPVTF